ncbi:unnamed protein product [Soboliphyme baturini]|uniref:Rho GDP-dissociation inhibitor 1 n=1 Tax=Soboliphyme baturini TaxID=241478 RepID=A0A183IJX4_9BILA|nr:unnamed protein product [Soboliphyme baturini]
MADPENSDLPDEIEPQVPYKPPAQVSVKEILEKDKEDPSLQRYKEQLLGNAENVVVDASNPQNVIVNSLTLLIKDLPEVVMDLSISKDEFMVGSYAPRKEMHCFTTPLEEAPSGEGSCFIAFICLYFFVFFGAIHRGSYKVKSLFTDDDKNEFLSWEWNLEIKKKD